MSDIPSLGPRMFGKAWKVAILGIRFVVDWINKYECSSYDPSCFGQ